MTDQVQWFSRYGEPITRPVTALKGGHTASYVARPKCWRCGGAGGGEQWRHTGWTCYRCGGDGLDAPKTYKVYTAEKLAKLNATKAKADAKRRAKAEMKEAAKRVEGRAKRRAFFREFGPLLLDAYKLRKDNPFLADMIRRAWLYGELSVGQLDAMPATIERVRTWQAERLAEEARKAAAKHVGKVGERLTARLTVVKRITGGDRYSSWGPWCLSILRDDAGNTLTTFGVCDLDEGDSALCKFTVKAHESRDGVPQTAITRLKEIVT